MSKILDLTLEKATQPHAVVLRQGAVKETGRVFLDFFPGKKAIVIADKTTFDVAGNTLGIAKQLHCFCPPKAMQLHPKSITIAM